MLKKNTAVEGFPIGLFINASTGAIVTTGTPTCKRILDGTGAACANAASYNSDAGQWEIDLAAADTNGAMVGLSFTLTDCLPITYRFRTQGIDDIVLEEAIRQGYRPGRDQIVRWAETAEDRGVNLVAAQTAIEELATQPSETDWVTLFIPPWVYELATGDVWGTNYVHYRALFPEKGGDRQNWVADTIDNYRPPCTQVISTAEATTTITQSASTVRMTGFAISQISDPASGSYSALYVSADDNAESEYRQMYFWHRHPYMSPAGPTIHRYPVGFAKHVNGLWEDCIANDWSWRIGYDAENASQFKCTMQHVQCGDNSIMGDYYLAEGTHKATLCDLRNVYARGQYGGIRSFGGCSSFGINIDSTCYFDDCGGGANCAGLGKKNEGTWINCSFGDNSGAGTTDRDYQGEFAGIAIGGVWGAGSLGGRSSASLDGGKLTGVLRDVIVLDNVASHWIEGAIIEDSLITMAAVDEDCLTLLDSNSSVQSSTILVVEGGTGIPINAASAQSVSAIGNRYNNVNAADQTNGIGTNVTNVGAPSTVTTDSASRSAITDHGDMNWTTATGFATQESLNNVAAAIDGHITDSVGPLATSTELAIVEGKVDDVLEDTGVTLPAAITGVWEAEERTLTSSASTVGPTAGTTVSDIFVTVYDSQTARLDARIRNWDGDDILQADITSITYTISLLDAYNPDTRTAVDGHTAVALNKASVIYDTLQSDSWSSDYNFSFIPDISTKPAFALSGRQYVVDVNVTPTTGQRLPGPRFIVTVK